MCVVKISKKKKKILRRGNQKKKLSKMSSIKFDYKFVHTIYCTNIKFVLIIKFLIIYFVIIIVLLIKRYFNNSK